MTLRNAFMADMKDPEFLAEATKAKLDINPLDGEELERECQRYIQTRPETLIPKAKEDSEVTVLAESVILNTSHIVDPSAALLKSAIGRRHIDGCDMLFVLIEIRVAQSHTLF